LVVRIAGHFSARRGRDLIRRTPCGIAENTAVIDSGTAAALTALGVLRELHVATGGAAGMHTMIQPTTTRQMPPWYGIVCRGSESTLQDYHEQHSTAFFTARNGTVVFQVQQGNSTAGGQTFPRIRS
jgi:hypothetical protein